MKISTSAVLIMPLVLLTQQTVLGLANIEPTLPIVLASIRELQLAGVRSLSHERFPLLQRLRERRVLQFKHLNMPITRCKSNFAFAQNRKPENFPWMKQNKLVNL